MFIIHEKKTEPPTNYIYFHPLDAQQFYASPVISLNKTTSSTLPFPYKHSSDETIPRGCLQMFRYQLDECQLSPGDFVQCQPHSLQDDPLPVANVVEVVLNAAPGVRYLSLANLALTRQRLLNNFHGVPIWPGRSLLAVCPEYWVGAVVSMRMEIDGCLVPLGRAYATPGATQVHFFMRKDNGLVPIENLSYQRMGAECFVEVPAAGARDAEVVDGVRVEEVAGMVKNMTIEVLEDVD